MPTTPGGRWSPNNGDGYDLITHLAAMQVSNESATATAIAAIPQNYHIGTDTQRLAISAPTAGLKFWVTDTGANAGEWTFVSAGVGWRQEVTPWVNLPLANSWVDYGSVYSPPSYRRMGGVVYVSAFIKGGATGIGTVVANLPTGFRPSKQMVFSTTTAPNNSAWVEVFTDGRIGLGSSASSTWTTLNFSFPAA